MKLLRQLGYHDSLYIQKNSKNSLFYITQTQNSFYLKENGLGILQCIKFFHSIIVIGKPHAKEKNYKKLILCFLHYCDNEKYTPYFLYIDKRIQGILKERHFKSIFIGSNLFLENKSNTFNLQIRERRSIRRSYTKGINHQLQFNELEGDLNEQINDLNQLSIKQRRLYFELDNHTTDIYKKRVFVVNYNSMPLAYAVFYFSESTNSYNLKLYDRCKSQYYFSDVIEFLLVSCIDTIFKEGYHVYLGTILGYTGFAKEVHPTVRQTFDFIRHISIPHFFSPKGLTMFRLKFCPAKVRDDFFAYRGKIFPFHIVFFLLLLYIKKPVYTDIQTNTQKAYIDEERDDVQLSQ